MKTLFLNGLMPERHGRFIRRLAEKYILTGTRLGEFQADPAINTIDYGIDLPTPDSALAAAQVQEQTRILAADIAADISVSPLGPPTGWQLGTQEIEKNIRPRVVRLLLQEIHFRAFLAQHPVDMVISGADYSGQARIIARLARRLGLPTLDLEHGFFFNSFAPDYRRPKGHMPTFFASEYVNLDNELEKKLVREELSLYPDQGTTFLALGTPVETVAAHGVPRDEALAALGLDGQKTQVLLVGSWHEARSLQKLVTAQVNAINGFEDLFRSLARRPFHQRMQLVIKLHPADAHPEVIDGVHAGLLQMAECCGIDRPLIKTDMLPEVLSASDVVVAMGHSSVLYDAFLLGKPTVTFFPGLTAYPDRPDWGRESTLPQLARVSVGTDDGTEVWRHVEAWLEPERRAQFDRDRETFSREYDLRCRTVDQKCDRILAWIAGQLGAGE